MSPAAPASLAPRLSAHDDRQDLASASRPEKHNSTIAYLALPQPIKAPSDYGRPVGRTYFKFCRILAGGLTRAVTRRGTDFKPRPVSRLSGY